MSSTTDRQSTPTLDDLGASLASVTAQATEASAQAYLDGLDIVLGVQRKVLDGTPFAPLAALLEAQAGLTRDLLAPFSTDAPHADRTTENDQTRALLADAAARTAGRKPRAARRKATPKAARPATRPGAGRKRATRVSPPVAGYAGLTADEVVAKLRDLSQADLAAVVAYEKAHDARATVLERATALTEKEPAPGYDGLTADEAGKVVADATPEVAKRIGAYERRHKNRATVLDATGKQ